MTEISAQELKSEQVRNSWQRWVEPWYLSYALLGTTAGGLAPILLPLIVNRTGKAGHIGLVMAFFNLGGLTAPLWGDLADRQHIHRWVLSGGLLAATVGMAVFPFTTSTVAYLGMAFLLGIGAAGAATVANLFLVEVHPEGEWDKRIGWLQTFYGGGQVAGLLLAGVLLSQVDLRTGLFFAAGLAALAALLGWLTTPALPRLHVSRPVLIYPGRHTEWIAGSPQRHYHRLSFKTVRLLGSTLRLPFGLFMAIWLITFAGSAAFFSFYPVLMRQVYGIAPGLSSMGFAVAAGLGLAVYSPAGRWSDRFSPVRVLQFALVIRLLAFLSLWVLGVTHFGQGWLALIGFLFVVLAWSLLSVSATALTAQLSSANEGEGMGIFNATTALAGVIGAALGGWIAAHWGYNGASVLAAGCVALGLALTIVRQKALRKIQNIGPPSHTDHQLG
jgi:DHA1 family tetracycline resistance protein-like MFS transporter